MTTLTHNRHGLNAMLQRLLSGFDALNRIQFSAPWRRR